MQNGRGKNPVVSLCTYSFKKNCDLNLSQMAVVRLKIKKKNHLNNCMTNALQFKDLNMNSNLRYSRLRDFEINQIEDGQGSL